MLEGWLDQVWTFALDDRIQKVSCIDRVVFQDDVGLRAALEQRLHLLIQAVVILQIRTILRWRVIVWR